MCTIADAKVRQNYNCYNVYFNECLLFFVYGAKIKETPAIMGQRF